VWIGLKNSDDQGTYFDVRAEIRKNSVVIATGETKNIQGVTRNPDLAKEVAVTFGSVSDAAFSPDDILSLRLLTKVADSGGHANAVGLRVYYDAVTRASRFGAALGAVGEGITVVVPPPGATVPAGPLLVRGTVQAGEEVGVTVNEEPAVVRDGGFTALVTVTPAVTELLVVATTVSGVSAEARQPLTVTGTPAPGLSFRVTPNSGVAPLSVGFQVNSAGPVSQISLDVEGDGIAEFQGPAVQDQPFVYSAAGVYTPTVRVTDHAGSVTQAVAVVQVFAPAELDVLLRSKWTAMGVALAQNDVDAAARVFTESVREAYREQFSDLASVGALSQVALDLGSLNLVRVHEGAVEYETRAVRDGMTYSFAVIFVIDRDGIWRLRDF
jgi:hypothetical protein